MSYLIGYNLVQLIKFCGLLFVSFIFLSWLLKDKSDATRLHVSQAIVWLFWALIFFATDTSILLLIFLVVRGAIQGDVQKSFGQFANWLNRQAAWLAVHMKKEMPGNNGQ
jgi:hypothetical protein